MAGVSSPRQGTRSRIATIQAVALVLILSLCDRASCQQELEIFRVPPGDPGDPQLAVEFGGYTASNLSVLPIAGPFRLVFVNSSSSGLFTLAIVTNFSAGSLSRVVWEANRDRPVRVNATLSLEGSEASGSLVLRDAGGEIVWSTGVLNGTGTPVLQEAGNFVVLDFVGTILWQSFDNPTDTVVLEQVLRRGMRLASRLEADANSSSGTYSMVMEPGGLVLYSNFSGGQEPYWIKSYDGADTLESALTDRACGFLAAGLRRGNFSIFDANNSTNSSCGINETVIIPLEMAGQNGSFIRLESDGNLRAYTLQSPGNWTESSQLIQEADSCSLPERCQPFGICSNGTCMECLLPDGTRSVWTRDCSPPLMDPCGRNFSSFNFAELRGMEYFSSRFRSGANTTLEACRSQCLQTCSCSAFFFWEESSSCFWTDKVGITLRAVADQRHVAYVKVAEETNRVTVAPAGAKLSPGATAGIVVGSLFLLLVALIPILLCISKKRSKKVEAVDYDSANYLDTLAVMKPMRFCRADLEKITSNFSKLIGTGDVGSVYEGALPDGRKVAVKRLMETSGEERNQLYTELATLGTIHHWNLVKLLGFCDQGSQSFLVYEYMPNGSLDRWIYRDSKENVLDWELRMGIAMGIARGLAYLHEECMEVHLNLTPQNVLLDASFVAKLSDYGLYRIIARELSKSGLESYHPPEWMLDTSVTEKCDVYSFGVILLEIISGSRSSNADKFFLPAYALDMARNNREMELVDKRIIVDTSEAKVRQGVSIAFQCLQEDPRSRPSMGDVVQMLQGSSPIPEVPEDSTFSWLKSTERSYTEEQSLLSPS